MRCDDARVCQSETTRHERTSVSAPDPRAAARRVAASTSRVPRARRVVLAAIATGCLAVTLGGCSFAERMIEDEVEAPSIEGFYELSDEDTEPGAPGALLRSQEIAGAPEGASAWRVIYHTTDQAGEPVLASGLVVAPSGAAPEGGRPVVAWGHPTTGTAPACAPSRWTDPFLLMEGLSDLLDRGFVVAATDYVGSGVDGPNSYLVGETAATAVLDSVRAAQELDTGASGDLVTWGHSQGGQAALFAASDASSYAPELTVRGVAVAAPAADLPKLLDAHLDDISGVTIGAYAFAAYAEVYGPSTPDATLESILTPAGAAAVPAMNELCLATQGSELHDLARPLIGGFMTSDPRTTEPWATLLAENVPDSVPANLPVFVAQGLADELIAPAETKAYADGLAANGNPVEYVEYPDIDHGTVGYRAVPRLLEWLDALAVPGATGSK